jgi:hypothetical protein
MPGVIPPDVDKAAAAGGPEPPCLSTDEKHAYDTLVFAYKNFAYGSLMGSRPQTLYGIADSPVGLAAWLLDHDDAAGQPAAAIISALTRTTSATGELTRDEILDNITLFWLTNTGVSSSRLYWEATDKKISLFCPKGVSIPVAVSVFPGEVYYTPRSWAERAYPKLIHYKRLEKGGHFAAWEQPMLLVDEMRAWFKSLRQVKATQRRAPKKLVAELEGAKAPTRRRSTRGSWASRDRRVRQRSSRHAVATS